MRNLKEGIRKQFYTELGKFIAPEGYVEHREADSSPTDYTFKKNVKPGVVWSLHSHLGHSKPPYAVFTVISCRYEDASRDIARETGTFSRPYRRLYSMNSFNEIVNLKTTARRICHRVW